MATLMTVSGTMATRMARARLHGLMAIVIMVAGKIITMMAKVLLFTQMETVMSESLRMTRKMAMAF